MTLISDSNCLATPGFAGFIPSLKYQYGKTYGNATRHILEVDPTLNAGKIRQEQSRVREEKKKEEDNASANIPKTGLWFQRTNKYATGDDRFTFPPVPGYTGYIPRSQHYFGKPYVVTTSGSLESFQKNYEKKDEIPSRVNQSRRPIKNIQPREKIEQQPSKQFLKEKKSTLLDEPYYAKHATPNQNKTLITGYTGFVPHLQHHFGQPYAESVRKSIAGFNSRLQDLSKASKHPKFMEKETEETCKHTKFENRPIPGFTGFVPGNQFSFASTYGESTQHIYNELNTKTAEERRQDQLSNPLPKKNIVQERPIPGYKGHIPGYLFTAERSYGRNVNHCLDNFDKVVNRGQPYTRINNE